MSESIRKGKETEFSPLSITMLKLPQYSGWFDIAEIAFYECMIVKQKSFKGKQFYYSCRRLTEELHIKRIRLDTIIRRFSELGIIEVEIKGMPKQHHFTVDFKQIIALIPQIYQFAYFDKLNVETCELYAYFDKLHAQTCKQKEYNKEFNKESISELRIEKKGEGDPSFSNFFNEDSLIKNSETDKEKKAREAAERKAEKEIEQQAAQKERNIERLKNLLKNTYKLRVNRYNKELEKGEFVRSHTKIVFSKADAEALYELSQQPDIDDSDIEGSFAAFIDEFIKGDTEIKKPIPYFLAKKPETGEFDTFITYHNLHLLYGYVKQ